MTSCIIVSKMLNLPSEVVSYLCEFLIDDYDKYKDVGIVKSLSRTMNKDLSELLKSKPFVKLISQCDLSNFDLDKTLKYCPSWVFACEFNIGYDVNEKATIHWTNEHRSVYAFFLKKHGYVPEEIIRYDYTNYNGVQFTCFYSEIEVSYFCQHHFL